MNYTQAPPNGSKTAHTVVTSSRAVIVDRKTIGHERTVGVMHSEGPNRAKRRELHFGHGVKGSLASKSRKYMGVAHALVAEQHAQRRRAMRARGVASSSGV